MGQYDRRSLKKLLQELESTAKTSYLALTQQSYAIRSMLSSCVLTTGKCARAKMLESKVLASLEQGEHARTRGFVLWECGVSLENITKPRGCMVYPQEGTEFIGVCSTSYTSTRTQNPYSSPFLLRFGSKFLVSCVDA